MSPVAINLIHSGAIIFSLFLAPLLFLLSLIYRKQFKQIDFSWKRPETNVFTIIAFVLNLTFFIGACFFFAGYLGRVELQVFQLTPLQMRTLCLDCLLLFGGVSLVFLAIQNFHIQAILREGIALSRWQWRKFNFEVELVRWENIKDYYMHSDYPVTHFHFLVSLPNLTFGRKSLKVPFYALVPFENLLEHHLQRQREAREHAREMLDRLSKDLSLEED
jgi:hypothetical protein